MESRSNGADGYAERLGHLVMRHVKVVLQDEDGSLLGRQSSEPALQLITIVDRWIRVGVGGTIRSTLPEEPPDGGVGARHMRHEPAAGTPRRRTDQGRGATGR